MKITNANAAVNTWTLRLFTFLVWALVALCAAYWAFKFVTTKPVIATATVSTPAIVVDTNAVAKLLGATAGVAGRPVNAAASSKYSLFGLVSEADGQGIALISYDGKPAKPYRVGSAVADDLVLKSISKTNATLAASNTAADGITLELPTRKPGTMIVSTTAMPPTLLKPGAPQVTPTAGGVLPSVSPGVAPGTAPGVVPGVLPSVNAAAGAMGLSDRVVPVSRFAPRASADGASATSAPAMTAAATATSSAVSER